MIKEKVKKLIQSLKDTPAEGLIMHTYFWRMGRVCGSTCCIAGKQCLLEGYLPVYPNMHSPKSGLVRKGTGKTEIAIEVAAKTLGLDLDDVAPFIFDRELWPDELQEKSQFFDEGSEELKGAMIERLEILLATGS